MGASEILVYRVDLHDRRYQDWSGIGTYGKPEAVYMNELILEFNYEVQLGLKLAGKLV